MVTEETVVIVEENVAAVPDKGKKVVYTSLVEKGFDLRHLGGQELSEADKIGAKRIWNILRLLAGIYALRRG
jgi:hypothetical protein